MLGLTAAADGPLRERLVVPGAEAALSAIAAPFIADKDAGEAGKELVALVQKTGFFSTERCESIALANKAKPWEFFSNGEVKKAMPLTWRFAKNLAASPASQNFVEWTNKDFSGALRPVRSKLSDERVEKLIKLKSYARILHSGDVQPKKRNLASMIREAHADYVALKAARREREELVTPQETEEGGGNAAADGVAGPDFATINTGDAELDVLMENMDSMWDDLEDFEFETVDLAPDPNKSAAAAAAATAVAELAGEEELDEEVEAAEEEEA